MQLKYFNDLSLYLGEKKKKSTIIHNESSVQENTVSERSMTFFFSLEGMGNYIVAAVTGKSGYLFHNFGEITINFISLSHQ